VKPGLTIIPGNLTSLMEIARIKARFVNDFNDFIFPERAFMRFLPFTQDVQKACLSLLHIVAIEDKTGSCQDHPGRDS